MRTRAGNRPTHYGAVEIPETIDLLHFSARGVKSGYAAGLGVIAATAVVAMAILSLPAAATTRPPTPMVTVLVRVGANGLDQGDKQELRQRGLDKIGIAQAVTQATDGGRLTRLEADKIWNSFVVRARRTAPDPMIAICKHSPKYPACQNR